jgi:hypothetical protein
MWCAVRTSGRWSSDIEAFPVVFGMLASFSWGVGSGAQFAYCQLLLFELEKRSAAADRWCLCRFIRSRAGRRKERWAFIP